MNSKANKDRVIVDVRDLFGINRDNRDGTRLANPHDDSSSSMHLPPSLSRDSPDSAISSHYDVVYGDAGSSTSRPHTGASSDVLDYECSPSRLCDSDDDDDNCSNDSGNQDTMRSSSGSSAMADANQVEGASDHSAVGRKGKKNVKIVEEEMTMDFGAEDDSDGDNRMSTTGVSATLSSLFTEHGGEDYGRYLQDDYDIDEMDVNANVGSNDPSQPPDKHKQHHAAKQSKRSALQFNLAPLGKALPNFSNSKGSLHKFSFSNTKIGSHTGTQSLDSDSGIGIVDPTAGDSSSLWHSYKREHRSHVSMCNTFMMNNEWKSRMGMDEQDVDGVVMYNDPRTCNTDFESTRKEEMYSTSRRHKMNTTRNPLHIVDTSDYGI